MLTSKDIQMIIRAEREVFITKDELKSGLKELSDKFDILQTSVDNFAKTVAKHDDEIKVTNHRLNKLENPA
jgi:hypothetical protein